MAEVPPEAPTPEPAPESAPVAASAALPAPVTTSPAAPHAPQALLALPVAENPYSDASAEPGVDPEIGPTAVIPSPSPLAREGVVWDGAEEPPPITPPDDDRWIIPQRPEIDAVIAEIVGPQRRAFAQALERAGRYLPMVREVLEEEGLPGELAYLPLVESHYLPQARSGAGALGLWQFIDTTARDSGLRVDWWVDERLDPELSTRAAARHLQVLFQRFGDWELSLAAYNAGPGGVARALERSGAEGFWELAEGSWLLGETRRYLPKLYASLEVVRDLEGYGFATVGEQLEWVYDTVRVSSPVDLYTVGRICGLEVAELRRLNPGLAHLCTPPGVADYPLRVPAGEGGRVRRALADLTRNERTDFVRYRVRKGDTLWAIARRFDTRSTAIAEINGVTDVRLLRPGQHLVVPSRQAGRQVPRGRTNTNAKRVAGTHRVHPGDTVSALARRYGSTVSELLKWNRLGDDGLIRPGETLIVYPRSEERTAHLARGKVHVVQAGDTLWGISRRYGITLDALMRVNGLEAGAVLRPGDEVVVEGTGPS